MARLTIRPATNRDAARIRELVFSVLDEYGLSPDPGSTDLDLDDVEASYFRPGGFFEVLLQSDGQIVGTVGLVPRQRGQAELRKMYLRPSARGRGSGKLLLDRALQKARELGFTEIWLETNSALKEAVALYRKYGFEPTETGHLAGRCDQAYLLRF